MNKQEQKKPYSKIAELLGRPQPTNITISERGNTISSTGEPNWKRLVETVSRL